MTGRFQQVLLTLAISIAPLALCHAATTDSADYENWYQVEVIIFKQSQPLDSGEIWPLEAITYPAEMVSIAPVDDMQITPYRLSQLAFISDSRWAEAGEPADNNKPVPQDDFLFGDKESASHNRQLLETINRRRIPNTDANPPEEETQGQLNDMNILSTGGPSENALPPDENSPDRAAIDAPISSTPGPDFNLANQLLDRMLPEAFRALDDDRMALNKIARSLRRSSKYQLVLHQSWLQPIQKKPTSVLIQAGDRYDDLYDIDGTLSFSRSRFLHVQADLWFTRFEPKFNQQQLMFLPPIELPENAGDYPELVALEKKHDTYIAVHSFPLRHSRRMRSSVLHYIDHPFFGILVKISRFDYSPESGEDATNGAAE